MADARRILRIQETMKELLGAILLREQDLPQEVFVTITRVSTSEDLEHASVFVSVFPEEARETVFTELERRVGDIQHLLNRKMRMRPVPKIRFVPEKEVSEADRIEAELYKLHKDE